MCRTTNYVATHNNSLPLLYNCDLNDNLVTKSWGFWNIFALWFQTLLWCLDLMLPRQGVDQFVRDYHTTALPF